LDLVLQDYDKLHRENVRMRRELLKRAFQKRVADCSLRLLRQSKKRYVQLWKRENKRARTVGKQLEGLKHQFKRGRKHRYFARVTVVTRVEVFRLSWWFTTSLVYVYLFSCFPQYENML